MKNRSGEKIKLASIDELLGVVNEESAMEIEISKIHPFKNHPFKVLDDEKMQDLVESVKINGVLTPVLLRMDENEEYEKFFMDIKDLLPIDASNLSVVLMNYNKKSGENLSYDDLKNKLDELCQRDFIEKEDNFLTEMYKIK